MNVQEQTQPDAAMQAIWSQLDAEDNGTAVAPIPSESQAATSNEPRPAPAKADARMDEQPAPLNEQTLLDKIAGLESNFNQVAQRLRHAEGHIGGLNNQLRQAQQSAQQAPAASAPTAAELRTAQGDPKAMQVLRDDYPEFASAMESVLNERLNGLEQRLTAQPQAQAQAGVSADELATLRREIEVEIQHPGWQKTVVAPEFLGWLNRQSREVQMLAQSAEPQDAVRLLDIHSEASGASVTKRNQRLSSAAAIPSGRGGASTRQKPTEEMGKAEYWAYLDQLDKSKG